MTRSSLAWGAIPGMRASSRSSRQRCARALELLREALHLGQQESPLQLGQAQVEAHRLVLIPGPVRDAPHVGQRPGPLRHGPVVAEDDPALAGVEVLAGLEGEGAGVADGSYPPPPPGAPVGLGASSTTFSPWRPATAATASRSAGWPAMCTATMARVRGVTRALGVCGVDQVRLGQDVAEDRDGPDGEHRGGRGDEGIGGMITSSRGPTPTARRALPGPPCRW